MIDGDLLHRLRNDDDLSARIEAADEIERLRAVICQSRDAMVKMRGDLLELQRMMASQGDAKSDTD